MIGRLSVKQISSTFVGFYRHSILLQPILRTRLRLLRQLAGVHALYNMYLTRVVLSFLVSLSRANAPPVKRSTSAAVIAESSLAPAFSACSLRPRSASSKWYNVTSVYGHVSAMLCHDCGGMSIAYCFMCMKNTSELYFTPIENRFKTLVDRKFLRYERLFKVPFIPAIARES